MPRIYYREKKLHIPPLQNEVITVDLFNKIMELSSFIPEDALQIFELPEKKSSLLFWKNDKPFKQAVIWNTEKPHTTYEYGDFYLPRAIVFFDEKDAYFPSDYYFIVNIDNQLELGYSKAGPQTAWYEQPQLWHKVTQPKIIKRFEKSIKELYKILKSN
nr:hypothetical protein [uncultured Capnocytophaga sp.]